MENHYWIDWIFLARFQEESLLNTVENCSLYRIHVGLWGLSISDSVKDYCHSEYFGRLCEDSLVDIVENPYHAEFCEKSLFPWIFFCRILCKISMDSLKNPY